MSERRFDIVFSGKLVTGVNPQDVQKNVAELFKIDGETLETLFSGEPVTIKKGVDRTTAVKYQQAMTKAGAVIQLVLHQAAEAPAAEQIPQPSASNNAPSEPAGSADESRSPPTATRLSVLPAGSDVLTASERKETPTTTIDTSHLQTEGASENPFLRDDTAAGLPPGHLPEPSYPSSSINASTGDLALGELGAGSGQALNPVEQPAIDTSHLSALQSDAGLLTNEEREQLVEATPTITFDLDLTLNDAGENLLDDSEKAPEVVAGIDTSGLSVEDLPSS